MRRDVRWSLDARRELVAITRHITADNPEAAAKVAGRIQAAAASLGEFATGRVGRVAGTFEKVVPTLPYILAYEIAPSAAGGTFVAVLHVIHGARD